MISIYIMYTYKFLKCLNSQDFLTGISNSFVDFLRKVRLCQLQLQWLNGVAS